MKKFNIKFIAVTLSMLLVFGACHDLDELNINPNAPDPEVTDLNLLMPTLIIDLGQTIVSLGIGDIAGVMQHTQKTGWSSGHNDYDWNDPGQSWSGYYGILRNADEFYNKAVEGELEFHQGVGLTLKAYAFGLIADLWGDAPFTEALKAESGPDFYKPVFNSQQDIYHGILAYLEEANTLLSKDNSEYTNVITSQDVLYAGDAAKWRKFANSLALRYYMRLQAKEPSVAQEGISKIAGDPGKYPLITVTEDEANIAYLGTSPGTSWPINMVYDINPQGEYMRRKPCATLVEALQALGDPRLGVWAEKVEIPLVLVPGTGVDRIVDGKREISKDVEEEFLEKWEGEDDLYVDYDQEYVGIPPSTFSAQAYNLTPNYTQQAAYNPHISQLSEMYKEASGSLLLMRLLSAAEVNFILAEAALYSWVSGNPETYYANGIKESLNAWEVGNQFDSYIQGAAYNGLESIMQQKWIASWTAAAESWFDWRRTGLPDLKAGVSARREKLPLRFYYKIDEDLSTNRENAEAAVAKLEPTPYKGTDQTNNSAWSKTWLLQGTNKPY
ncbi:Starch-binding associating with outer membrane [Mariniphaga anaerophila]|uniref:Starch-binding associating with outer membrane n=1 Tax=Mariniphaga anaerophila TaxID=1484053 RepID=A0A1M4ZWB8_9BACT|nr:SusD/RagB family nutrient-binding outer membrane lipoprotein [Mariniphaga anaerophila]SHF22323.1 Starch-binding associating with outer membrane [Mariniphaga anaerophila]